MWNLRARNSKSFPPIPLQPNYKTVTFVIFDYLLSMKKILLWLTRMRIYNYALVHIIPYIRFSVYYTSLRGWKYQRGYRLLKPGHILLSTDRKKLTTILIPGEFTHASFCVEKGSDWEISEMTHRDYTKSAFFDICKEADRVVILECPDWDAEYTKAVIEKCRSFHDAKYDVEFNLGVEALYCSELVYQSDFEHRLQVNLEDLAGLGCPYISPTGLYQAHNVRIVWDSDNEYNYD